MILVFTLSMPGVSSWDGKWSGEGRLFAIVKTFANTVLAADILAKKNYSYCFTDGWRARVDVRAVDAGEASRIQKESNGFCGYDWMVESILRNGWILDSSQEKEAST